MSEDAKLTPEKIHFLSFEGGGGKGNAYMGAIKGLIEKKVITFKNDRLDASKIQGISGSSAGAITATILGLGMTYAQMKDKVTGINFEGAFDSPKVGREATVPIEGHRDYTYDNPDKKKPLANAILTSNDFISNFVLPFKLVEAFFDWYINNKLKEENDALAKKLTAEKTDYLKCLFTDFGLFTGRYIHMRINSIITNRINELNTPKYGQLNDPVRFLCNFKTYKEIFGVDLKITGVNMRTGNLQIFSARTTPYFPVASAVRISMSIPFAFKPVIIEHTIATRYTLDGSVWMGHWVDGGLFDNAPVRVFDPAATILLRLGNRAQSARFDSLWTFIKTFISCQVLGAGSGTTTLTTFEAQNIIELNVDNLRLFKFQLSKNEFDQVEATNFKVVMRHFGG